MPYHVARTGECPASKPFGVVDVDGKVHGCHRSKQAAHRQIAAIEANESAELDRLALVVEQVELAAEIQARRVDWLSGMVPPGVNRSLFAHELAARTDFAAIFDANDGLSRDLTRLLAQQRQRVLEALAADLAAAPDVATGYRRLLGLRTAGLEQVAGVAEVVEATRSAAEDLLLTHAMDAAERLRQEAIRQGRVVPEIAALDLGTIERLEDQARRLAMGPPADLLRTVADEAAARRLTFATPAQLADHVRGLGASLSLDPLEDYASSAAAGTEGTTRSATAERIGTPAAIYASELMDRNTCGPCSMVDGHRYVDHAAALVDYPGGTFRNCAGGLRCRGTLVFVWDAEAVPTDDDNPPAGPATLPPEEPPPSPPTPPPAPAGPPPPPTPAEPSPPNVLEPSGATDDEVAQARRDVPRLRAQYRAHALEVRDDAAAWFERTDTGALQRPPERQQRRGASGRVETGSRAGAANWDWYDGLHPNERKRLVRNWLTDPDSPISPDVMVDQVAARFNLDPRADEDRIIAEWLHQSRRHDAASTLARGKLPVADAYGGADINALVDSPYNLRRLFGADLDDAARHVAEVNADVAEVEAARVFPSVRPGYDPPWALDEDAYVDELTRLDEAARNIEPLDEEWGTFRPEDQAVHDRIRELVPPLLDDADNPVDARTLHRKIIALARRARLVT